MRGRRFWRDRFRVYRMWILERRAPSVPGSPVVAPADLGSEPPPRRDGPEATAAEFVLLDRHARREWAVHHGDEADWRQFQVAIEHDHDLVLARRGDVVVGWAWLGYERVYLAPLGSEIRLAEGCAYLYDAYVKPEERGRGLGHGLVAARCRRADERGIGRLLSHVLVGNEASLRTLRSHGFATIGRTAFLRALALRMWTRQPVPQLRPAGSHATAGPRPL
jgi:ribosomal protein S18 acetylase RimI-like enzyme